MIERGKFIAIYGPNNIGKSEQASRLVQNLRDKGVNASYLKYPVYDLDPTGPILNSILREGRKSAAVETQTYFAKNRRDFEPTLKNRVATGEWIVAEDYTGTGFAWGITYGVDLKILEELNMGLIDEDLAICLLGERFSTGIEKEHLHEQSGRWERNREMHRKLAGILGWNVVNANQTMEKVAKDIKDIVDQKLLNTK